MKDGRNEGARRASGWREGLCDPATWMAAFAFVLGFYAWFVAVSAWAVL